MNQGALDKILRSPRLPSLPSIAVEVINLAQRDVNMQRIADTLQHDPALSTKILRTANSAFYGQSQTIGTVSRALVVLGLSAVKTLALGFSLVADLKRQRDIVKSCGSAIGVIRRPPSDPPPCCVPSEPHRRT